MTLPKSADDLLPVATYMIAGFGKGHRLSKGRSGKPGRLSCFRRPAVLEH